MNKTIDPVALSTNSTINATTNPAPATPPMSQYSSRMLLGLAEMSRIAEREQAGAASGGVRPFIAQSLLHVLQYTLSSIHPPVYDHVRRTSILACGLAKHLGASGERLEQLRLAALLHDIGKLGVPEALLYKPGRQTAEEVNLMSLYLKVGMDVLQACRCDSTILDMITESKHQVAGDLDDSTGDPRMLKLGSRILAVADAYDSLRHAQTFRGACTHADAMRILSEGKGTSFDASVVDSLDHWLRNGGTATLREEMAVDKPISEADCGGIDPFSISQIFAYLFTLESMYSAFYLVDADLRFIVWNRGAERLFGERADAILGRQWCSRVVGYADRSKKTLADNQCPLVAAMENAQPIVSQQSLVVKSGNPIPVELQTVPVVDSSLQVHGAAEIFRRLDDPSDEDSHEMRQLKVAASRDALTRIANRGELERRLRLLEKDLADDPGTLPFSVIFVDADHFKSVNDTYGHSVGDQVLIDISKLLQYETYSGETVGRYGGEEFVILCPETSLEQAARKAERLRDVVQQTEIGGISGLKVTVSLGVAQFEAGDTGSTTLQRADKALYFAKNNGRNQTCQLTRKQESSDKENAATKPVKSWKLGAQLRAQVAPDMVLYKLGAFCRERRAKLGKSTRNTVNIKLGRWSILTGWRYKVDKLPLQVEVKLITPNDREGRSLKNVCVIELTISPRAYLVRHAHFLQSAEKLIKDLKEYLIANQG